MKKHFPLSVLKIALLLFVMVSCKSSNSKSIDSKSNTTVLTNLNFDNMRIRINDNNAKSDHMGCDYKSIHQQLMIYRDSGIVAIPIAEHIIKRCIGSLNEAEKDSVYFQFVDLFCRNRDKLTASFEKNYLEVQKKIIKNVNDPETKEFKRCLDICGLMLLSSEGEFYVDAKNDYFYNLFKGKVSIALDEFDWIRSNELKQMFSEDASLFISFDDLYGRVITWEDFLAKYPHFFLKNDAIYYYTIYLATLLTGMDNTPTIDLNTQKLLPEVKSLYEKVIAKNEDRKSTKIISDYYDLLKSNDFKQPDSIKNFLRAKGLDTMIGVQPDTR